MLFLMLASGVEGQMKPDQMGPLVKVNPVIPNRPLRARFEFIQEGSFARMCRMFRDREGRVRFEFQVADVPGSTPIMAISLMDPVADVSYFFVEGIQQPTRQPLGQIDFRMAVSDGWSLPTKGTAQEEKIQGFECELYSGMNAIGERLEVWVSHDYGLNLREIVTSSAGTRKHEWRLIDVTREEPGETFFTIGNGKP